MVNDEWEEVVKDMWRDSVYECLTGRLAGGGIMECVNDYRSVSRVEWNDMSRFYAEICNLSITPSSSYIFILRVTRKQENL